MQRKLKTRPKVNICPQCGNMVPIGDKRFKPFVCKRCKYEIQPEEKLIKEYKDDLES